jgi:hypothetical protein
MYETLIQEVEDAKELCRRISSYETDKLFTRRMFSGDDVGSRKPLLQATVELAKDLIDLPLEQLPVHRIVALRETGKTLASRLDELQDMVRKAGDRLVEETDAIAGWVKNRVSFLGALQNNCEAFCDAALPAVSFLKIQSTKPTSSEEALSKLLTDFKTLADESLDEFRLKQKEFDSTLQVVRDTAAQAGVTHHAQTFRAIASGHEKASRWWLLSAGGFILLTVGLAYLFLFYAPAFGGLNDAATIQRIVSKVVALSILYYAALWSAKNYRTHRHLAVLNAHRQSALHTFDAFIKAASGDDQTKNAVLLEATRCIFTPANTGYLGASEEDSQGSRIVEIVKTVGSGTGSK